MRNGISSPTTSTTTTIGTTNDPSSPIVPALATIIAAYWVLLSWAPKHCSMPYLIGLAITTAVLSLSCLAYVVSVLLDCKDGDQKNANLQGR